jgi:hypothetical protein
MDKICIDEIGIKDKIKSEVTRFKKFQQTLLGISSKIEVHEIDIRNYVKFILQNGEELEKRELMKCLKSKITVIHKRIILQ